MSRVRDLRFTFGHVTLRSVGWKRKGLLEPVYAQLRAEGVEHPVKELAARTGFPAGNLSMINSGKREMTDNYAVRIAEEVRGITPSELGSSVGESAQRSLENWLF